MQKTALLILVLTAVIAVVGMLNLDSNTGLFINSGRLLMSGAIYDQNGDFLFTGKQIRYQALMNSIVAVTKDGRVVGSGQVWPGQYSLILFGDWRSDDVLTLRVGFYDAKRPDRNSLADCTKVKVADLFKSPGFRQGKVLSDLYCDFMTFQKTTTMMYR